jgi:hypothetical protein
MIEPGTKLRVIKSEIMLLDDDNKWVNMMPSNMVFKYTGTEYVEPKVVKKVTPIYRQNPITSHIVNTDTNVDSDLEDNVINSKDKIQNMIVDLSKIILDNFNNKIQQKPSVTKVSHNIPQTDSHHMSQYELFNTPISPWLNKTIRPDIPLSSQNNHSFVQQSKPFKSTTVTDQKPMEKIAKNTKENYTPQKQPHNNHSLNDVRNVCHLIYNLKKKQAENPNNKTNPVDNIESKELSETISDIYSESNSESEIDTDNDLNVKLDVEL